MKGRGSRMTPEQRREASERMKARNPMANPETAQRVAAQRRGMPINRSPEGTENIRAASRKRMLSERNPMKNPETAHAVATTVLQNRGRSKNEWAFEAFCRKNDIVLEFLGDGRCWIGRRNPDYTVPGQRKFIEVAMENRTSMKPELYNRLGRTVDSYGWPTVEYYEGRRFRCLVVFRKHKRHDPPLLAETLRDFIANDWSGVWDGTALTKWSGSLSPSPSTTSPANPPSGTSPTAS